MAVEDGEKLVTYGELNAQAEAVRAALARQGVRPGDAVAISLDRSADLIAGILGILKAGAAYVPLDSSYPPGRLEWMLRESGAKVLIGSGDIPRLFPARSLFPSRIACAREPLSAAAAHRAPVRDGGLHHVHLRLHRGTQGRAHPASRDQPPGPEYRLRRSSTPRDVVAHASNTSLRRLDFRNLGRAPEWRAARDRAAGHAARRRTSWWRFLQARSISVLFLTTPLFHHFAREIPGWLRRLALPGGGRGRAPAAGRPRRAGNRASQHLVNGYGPTEVTTFAVCHEVSHVPAEAVSIPIGRPIANTTAYILDQRHAAGAHRHYRASFTSAALASRADI